MSGAQWTIPIVLGLAAAGLTWGFAPDEIHVLRPQDTVEVRTDAPYVLVPLPGTSAYDATLLRYNATGTRHGLATFLDVHAGWYENGTFAWDGNGWECIRPGAPPCERRGASVLGLTVGEPGNAGADAWQEDRGVAGNGAMQDGAGAAERAGDSAQGDDTSRPRQHGVARFSHANATAQLTFFMFTSSGHLLATNTLRSKWDSYDLHGEFMRFSATTWHLGAGDAPPGAQTLPMFRAEAMALLDGTPVGGVQGAVLETHPYDWLLGPVWVAVRVEALA